MNHITNMKVRKYQSRVENRKVLVLLTGRGPFRKHQQKVGVHTEEPEWILRSDADEKAQHIFYGCETYCSVRSI